MRYVILFMFKEIEKVLSLRIRLILGGLIFPGFLANSLSKLSRSLQGDDFKSVLWGWVNVAQGNGGVPGKHS